MITMSDLSDDACDRLVIEFLKMTKEGEQEADVVGACKVLLDYMGEEDD